MKIEVGKYYRTRDGRKVGPMVQWTIDANHPFEVTNEDGTDLGRSLWSESGRSDECSDLDLTSEWIDPPKTWGEMTDAEKVEDLEQLFNKCVKGLVTEEYCNGYMEAIDHMMSRIKPEPVREKVTLYGVNGYQGDIEFDSGRDFGDWRITFTTTDGKPDLDSIKMEEV